MNDRIEGNTFIRRFNIMRCKMYKCRDNASGICVCRFPMIGENATCLSYIPMANKGELDKQVDETTQLLYKQLGLSPKYVSIDEFQIDEEV